MFAFAFISTARLTIRPTTIRLVRTGVAALAIIFAAVSLAEAKGFGGGGSGGGTKSFAQKVFSNQKITTTSNTPNKTIALKQDNKPQKISMDNSSKCSDKSCYHHCHHYCDYYCGWDYCNDYDLQLISVQMLDGGNPGQGIGPMFRVTFRNNSFSSINRPFSLSLTTFADPTTAGGLPVGVRVRSIGGFETAAVDIRMPLEAMRPGLAMMQAIVDSHREIGEINESNNVLLVKLAEVRPIETEKAIAAPVTEAASAVAADATLQAEIAKEPMADEQDD